MKFVKNLMVILAMSALGLLAACSPEPKPTPVVRQVSIPTPTAEQLAMKAKADIATIAKSTVAKYGMRNPAACNPATSAPPELLSSKSYQDFPLTGPSIYKQACNEAIAQAKDDEKRKDAQAVARAKAKEQKLAAKRAKAAELAAKQARPRHASAMQPVRPSAVKPVAQTGHRN